ncbi:MAG: hypothetical protein AAB354_05085, partial [candidate division KSB1 bacterium]
MKIPVVNQTFLNFNMPRNSIYSTGTHISGRRRYRTVRVARVEAFVWAAAFPVRLRRGSVECWRGGGLVGMLAVPVLRGLLLR